MDNVLSRCAKPTDEEGHITRPTYQPPRALRMRDQHVGAGQTDGVGNCYLGPSAHAHCKAGGAAKHVGAS